MSTIPGLTAMAPASGSPGGATGVCSVGDKVFFTSNSITGGLFRVSKKTPGTAPVREDAGAGGADELDVPTDCAFDQGSGLLVADAKGVWSYAGALGPALGGRELLFPLQNATSVAVFGMGLDRDGDSSSNIGGKVLAFVGFLLVLGVLAHVVLHH